jgi:hypothetical protein
MKKQYLISLLILAISLITYSSADAQCSICTKTASQLGEKPAAALNTAIIYLMGAPFAIIGFIAWRWWKNNKSGENNTQ